MISLNSKPDGFTLIEILAVVAIVGILAVVAVTQIRQDVISEASRIGSSKQSLNSTVSLARNYSMTGHNCCGSTTIPSGYGVHIPLTIPDDNTTYYLYADFDGDRKYTVASTDEIMNTYFLQDKVRFTQCSSPTISVLPASNNYCDIHFTYNSDLENRFSIYSSSDSAGGDWVTDYIDMSFEHVQDPTYTDSVRIYEGTLLVE